jgi:sugar phosphate isomerase/epimerase
VKLSLALQTPEIEVKLPVALLTGSFEERLRKAADLGYDGVELMVSDPSRLDVNEIRSLLRNVGLHVSAIGSGAVAMVEKCTLLAVDTETGARAEHRLHELIEFAAQIGAGCVTIGSFRGRAAWVKDIDGRSRLADVLKRAAEKADENGVMLALEPLNRYESDIINTAEEGLVLIEQMGKSSVGIVLDTYHMNIEETTFTGCIERVASRGRLIHLHIGDSNRLPPGQGHIDFQKIVEALTSNGYSGFLSAELLPLPDGDEAAKRTVEYMRKFVQKER